LSLLFASAGAGIIFGGLFARKATAEWSGRLLNQPAVTNRLSEVQTFFEKPSVSRPVEEIVCQGVILTANRGARVVINGETVKIREVVGGAKILEITASNVLVECNGETHRLAPGESFSPGKK
ncbi:MAG: hypothetical protein PHP93_04295, partial [Kiritimatiellales bacterium]|nr:hypothetical protein [Kiritimatiellales bacterium]